MNKLAVYKKLESTDVSHARLPANYKAAKVAIAKCEKIDECQNWADKAEALASYAKQIHDDTLRKYADRIQARNIRRCGELLEQIKPKHGANQNISTGRGTKVLTRQDAAQTAGMSKRQKDTALRVPKVPSDEFEREVESDNPPRVTELAERGTKKQTVDLEQAPGATRDQPRAGKGLVFSEEFVLSQMESRFRADIERWPYRSFEGLTRTMYNCFDYLGLAQRSGTKNRLKGRDPEEFAAATKAQGAIKRLAEVAADNSPEVVVRGAFEKEYEAIVRSAELLVNWLSEIRAQIHVSPSQPDSAGPRAQKQELSKTEERSGEPASLPVWEAAVKPVRRTRKLLCRAEGARYYQHKIDPRTSRCARCGATARTKTPNMGESGVATEELNRSAAEATAMLHGVFTSPATGRKSKTRHKTRNSTP